MYNPNNPVEIWDISLTAAVTHHEHDIVVDNQVSGTEGIYNAADDGLDDAAVARYCCTSARCLCAGSIRKRARAGSSVFWVWQAKEGCEEMNVITLPVSK